jgi:hypothetical protein
MSAQRRMAEEMAKAAWERRRPPGDEERALYNWRWEWLSVAAREGMIADMEMALKIQRAFLRTRPASETAKVSA